MRIAPAILMSLLTTSLANSEPLDFAVYRLTGNERALIAQGKLDYTLEDIDVVNWGSTDGHPSWNKSLKLTNGFNMGILVVRHFPTPGFGLWLSHDRHPAGFSWEWFAPGEGDIFRKLQGEGRVRVTQSRYPDGAEIQSVEFLTDITLRFNENVNIDPGLWTHEIVVSKGSVFRVAQ